MLQLTTTELAVLFALEEGDGATQDEVEAIVRATTLNSIDVGVALDNRKFAPVTQSIATYATKLFASHRRVKTCTRGAGHDVLPYGTNELTQFSKLSWVHSEEVERKTSCLPGANAGEVLKVRDEFIEDSHGLEIVCFSTGDVVRVEVDEAYVFAVEVELSHTHGAVTVFLYEDFGDVRPV